MNDRQITIVSTTALDIMDDDAPAHRFVRGLSGSIPEKNGNISFDDVINIVNEERPEGARGNTLSCKGVVVENKMKIKNVLKFEDNHLRIVVDKDLVSLFPSFSSFV